MAVPAKRPAPAPIAAPGPTLPEAATDQSACSSSQQSAGGRSAREVLVHGLIGLPAGLDLGPIPAGEIVRLEGLKRFALAGITRTLGPGGMVAQPLVNNPRSSIILNRIIFMTKPSFASLNGSAGRFPGLLSSIRRGRT